MNKWVYSFGAGQTEGDATMRELLGGKGANLAEIAKLACRSAWFHHFNRSMYLLLRP